MKHMTDVTDAFKALSDDAIFYRIAKVMAANDGKPEPEPVTAATGEDKRRRPQADKDRVFRLIDDGMTYKDISAETGVAVGTIVRWKQARERDLTGDKAR